MENNQLQMQNYNYIMLDISGLNDNCLHILINY
jgi:hypothetical protein